MPKAVNTHVHPTYNIALIHR